jgi:Tol biopolymer transport system component
MLTLRSASLVSTLALVSAVFACSGSDTNPGGGTTTSGTSSTGGSGGSLPTAGQIVVPLMPAGAAGPELLRMKPDGSGLVQLTQNGDAGMPTDNNDFPVISPDGKTIVFASGRDHAPEINPMRRAIYVMDIDGGNAHRLTTAPTEKCTEYPGDVSPDGKWVVFTRACDQSIDPVTSGLDKLFRIHLDGTGEEKLAPNDPLVQSATNQDTPVFTRDGGGIVFVSEGAGGGLSFELFKLDLGTLELSQITKTADAGYAVDVRRPMIAPKGDLVYFTSSATGFSGARMEKINLDGTSAGVLFDLGLDPTTAAYVDDRFALSPGGDAFVFATLTGSNGDQAIVVSGLDGKDRKTIYPSTTFVGWGNPSWR